MRKSARTTGPAPRTEVRCAIYTRKSSEEGLEQDFNSLDAQREACEAFILSQKHEGWVCLAAMYDDGGISGATMERPALKRLLADIAAGLVDAVVVYKVDRLTRSLGDFAKIVEIFDAQRVSFVSVTQQFNTTTSMGRLTLNMLLSFAQFEREVTGERIRDKIAASKKKGMWMGGVVPLGYDAKDRKLIVNETEAGTVRHIFERYLALGSVFDLKAELERTGVTSKVRIDRHDRRTGGTSIGRGALYTMLGNPIYRGQIVHKDAVYPGEHEAIIDEDVWVAVQAQLAGNRRNHKAGRRAAEPSLLAGLIFDDLGQRMTPSHATKKGTRYRYYVSQGLIRGRREDAPRGRRIPAGDLEALVADRLRIFLATGHEVHAAFEPCIDDVIERTQRVARAAELSRIWPQQSPTDKRAILLTLVDRIDVRPDGVDITVLPHRLAAVLRDEARVVDTSRPPVESQPVLTLTVPVSLKRAGIETRLLIDGPGATARTRVDRSLHRRLAQAHRYRDMVMRNGNASMNDLALEAGVVGSYFTRILRLSFLAPDIVTTILRDQHPVDLTANRLANDIRLPLAWDAQRAALGMA